MGKQFQNKLVICVLVIGILVFGVVVYLSRTKDVIIKTLYSDLDFDGEDELIEQRDATISIYRKNQDEYNLVWESNPEWNVNDFLVGDINQDGRDELLILLWREGNYGQHKPIWFTEEDDAYTQHIYIYHFEEEDSLSPVWMSSGLRPEVKSWSMNEDNTIRIITVNDEDTTWRYAILGQGFGLERIK